MIGILLITHGSYGEALVQNACHVLNKRPAQLNQLGVAAQDDPLDLLPLARQMLHLVDDGDGVLLMTEKDAVKCAAMDLGEAWVLPVAATIEAAHDGKTLLGTILEKLDGRTPA